MFRVGAAVFAMCDAIHRVFVLLFGHPERIDIWILVVDALIVALIAWVDIPEKLHKRRVGKRLASLLPFVERGQELQRTIPEYDATYDAVTGKEWMNSVVMWGKETRTFLEQCSPAGARLFEHTAETAQLVNPQYVHTESGRSFPIHGDQRDSYQRLVARLNNLHRIMEKPDAYF